MSDIPDDVMKTARGCIVAKEFPSGELTIARIALAIMAERDRCAPKWSPIATAPRSGHRILLWNAGWTGPITGQYYGDAPGLGVFYEVERYKDRPTHWMPLPDGPAS